MRVQRDRLRPFNAPFPPAFGDLFMNRPRNLCYKFGEFYVYKLIASHLRRQKLRNYHTKFTQLITGGPELIHQPSLICHPFQAESQPSIQPANNRTRRFAPMAMDLENPDCVTRYFIRRIDPAIFYWIFCCFRQILMLQAFFSL